MVLCNCLDGQQKLANRLAQKIGREASVSRGVVSLTDTGSSE